VPRRLGSSGSLRRSCVVHPNSSPGAERGKPGPPTCPPRALDTGKGDPMPYVLNLIYLMLLFVSAPFLIYRGLRVGKYREGWAEKVLGKAPRRIGGYPC